MGRSLFMLAGVLAVSCVPAFAGSVATPEPNLGILTAVGVGAIVLVAKKVKNVTGRRATAVFWTGIQANLYWILFSAGLVAVALWEVSRPWRAASEQLTRRWRNHALFVAIAAGFRVALSRQHRGGGRRGCRQQFGLLNRPWLPLTVRFIFGFVLLDLLRYGLHRAFIRSSALESAPGTPFRSGCRFSHGTAESSLEVLAAQGVFCLAVALLAPPVSAVLAMELVAIVQAFFTHANANLPVWIERLVGKVVITPRMHRIHHSEEMREQNANLGEVFPWWDRMFGTYLEPRPRVSTRCDRLEGIPKSRQLGPVIYAGTTFRPIPSHRRKQSTVNALCSRSPLALTEPIFTSIN